MEKRTIIIKELAESKERLIRELVATSQKAYRRLVGMQELHEVPAPTHCTMDWASAIGAAEQEKIRQSDILPYEEKTRLIKQWNGIRVNVVKCVSDIAKLLDYVPAENIGYDPKLKVLFVKDIDQLAAQAATRDVPPEANAHWQLVSKAKDAIDQLRKWEDENNVIRTPLRTLIQHNEENILRLWAMGKATIDSLSPELIERYKATYKFTF